MMKKDKIWLKEQLSYLQDGVGESFNHYSEGLNAAYNTLEILIDQLDEPEITEEQGWGAIETYNHQHIAPAYVKVYKSYIQQGILPSEIVKQEKVVIPQFVGDFITEIKPNFNIRSVFTLKNNKHEQGQEWALDNPDVFARAWLDGFVVEEEKLYKVLLPGVESLDRQMCMHEETKVIGFADDGYNSRKYSKDDEIIRLFTEQEIKNIDERYWAFAEEITK